MKYFFLKLIAPRSDFMQTMAESERSLMQQHAAYLQTLMDRGFVVAFGPVVDPRGPFGMGLFSLPDSLDPASLMDQDPTILSKTGFRYEVFPMPRLVVKRDIPEKRM